MWRLNLYAMTEEEKGGGKEDAHYPSHPCSAFVEKRGEGHR